MYGIFKLPLDEGDSILIAKYENRKEAYNHLRRLRTKANRMFDLGKFANEYAMEKIQEIKPLTMDDLSDEWRGYVEARGMQSNHVALSVAAALEDPAKCDPKWFSAAVYAVESNIANHGLLAKKAELNGWSYEMISAAMAACHRHEETDYDARLASGMSRDEARATKE